VPYSIAVSKLRRPFLSDRYFFIVLRLLRRREKLTEPDFAPLARAFKPGEGWFGQPPGRLAVVKSQGIRRHERTNKRNAAV